MIMAQQLRIERDSAGPAGDIVTIYLDDPAKPVTVLDRAMIARLDATLGEIGADPAGLVLATSHGRVFVAGADLQEINDLSDDDLATYLAEGQRVFGRISALSCCTVAAINGAALGGGLELALHCDVLLGVSPENPDKPYRVGLPEASLGLCPGWGGTNTLPARIEPGLAIGATSCGSTFTAPEASNLGLFESMHPSREALIAAAQKRAQDRKPARAFDSGEPINITDPEIAPRARTAFDRIKADLPQSDAAYAVAECVQAGLANGWQEALDHERTSLIALRKTETAKMKIKAFFDRNTSQ